jgi:outer membrane biosynthesis protein TonB
MVAIKTVILSVALAAVAVNAQEVPSGEVTLPATTLEVEATVTTSVDAAGTEPEPTEPAEVEAEPTEPAEVDAAAPTESPAPADAEPTDGTTEEVEPTAAEDGTPEATDAPPAADATPTEVAESPEGETVEEGDGPEATAVIPIEASVTGTSTVVVATGEAGPAATNGTINTGEPAPTEPAAFEGAASILSWSKEIAVAGAALFGFAVLF